MHPPFDPEQPPPEDLKSLAWAVWVFYDRSGATNLSLEQVQARLITHKIAVGEVDYYRPFATLAEYITRPDQMIERGRNDLNDRYIDPFRVAEEFKALQSRLDAQIPKSAQGASKSSGDFTGNLEFEGY